MHIYLAIIFLQRVLYIFVLFFIIEGGEGYLCTCHIFHLQIRWVREHEYKIVSYLVPIKSVKLLLKPIDQLSLNFFLFIESSGYVAKLFTNVAYLSINRRQLFEDLFLKRFLVHFCDGFTHAGETRLLTCQF
jgi:hypothetical protein